MLPDGQVWSDVRPNILEGVLAVVEPQGITPSVPRLEDTSPDRWPLLKFVVRFLVEKAKTGHQPGQRVSQSSYSVGFFLLAVLPSVCKGASVLVWLSWH